MTKKLSPEDEYIQSLEAGVSEHEEERNLKATIDSPYNNENYAPENELEYKSRIFEPAYKELFPEIQRDLILSNLDKQEKNFIQTAGNLLRNIEAIEEQLKETLPSIRRNIMSELVYMVSTSRAVGGKTLDAIGTTRQIIDTKFQAGKPKEPKARIPGI